MNYKNHKKTDIIAAFSTHHSFIVFGLSKPKDISKSKGSWKLNNSLYSYNDFAEKMKTHSYATLNSFS